MPYGQPYLLSGRVGRASPRGSPGPVVVAALLFLILLTSGTYFLWQRTNHKQKAPTANASLPRPMQLSRALQEDAVLHLHNASVRLQQNLADLAKARQRLALVEAALSRTGLPLEQARVQAALAFCQQASVQASQSFEEIQVLSAQFNTQGEKQ